MSRLEVLDDVLEILLKKVIEEEKKEEKMKK